MELTCSREKKGNGRHRERHWKTLWPFSSSSTLPVVSFDPIPCLIPFLVHFLPYHSPSIFPPVIYFSVLRIDMEKCVYKYILLWTKNTKYPIDVFFSSLEDIKPVTLSIISLPLHLTTQDREREEEGRFSTFRRYFHCFLYVLSNIFLLCTILSHHPFSYSTEYLYEKGLGYCSVVSISLYIFSHHPFSFHNVSLSKFLFLHLSLSLSWQKLVYRDDEGQGRVELLLSLLLFFLLWTNKECWPTLILKSGEKFFLSFHGHNPTIA